MVSKGRAWYLVALRGADLRTYRVSRIASAELTDERFDRPPDFDLGGYWSAAVRRLRGQWPSYPVVLAVRDPVVARFAARPGARIVADVPGLDDGWSLVHTDLENRGEALGVVLSLAGDAIAREPAELCREVAMAAARIADRHRG